jgi:hypothetical protein
MTYEYKEQLTPIADGVIGTAAHDITRTSTPAGRALWAISWFIPQLEVVPEGYCQDSTLQSSG